MSNDNWARSWGPAQTKDPAYLLQSFPRFHSLPLFLFPPQPVPPVALFKTIPLNVFTAKVKFRFFNQWHPIASTPWYSLTVLFKKNGLLSHLSGCVMIWLHFKFHAFNFQGNQRWGGKKEECSSNFFVLLLWFIALSGAVMTTTWFHVWINSVQRELLRTNIWHEWNLFYQLSFSICLFSVSTCQACFF